MDVSVADDWRWQWATTLLMSTCTYVQAFKSDLALNQSRAYCSKFDVLLKEAGCTIKLNHFKNLSWLILSQLLLMPEILLP